MPTLKEVEFYLKGLWLLFKQDPSGFAYLDLTDRGAMRSFWAILWALPAILISFAWWRLLYLQGLPEGTETGGLFFFRHVVWHRPVIAWWLRRLASILNLEVEVQGEPVAADAL